MRNGFFEFTVSDGTDTSAPISSTWCNNSQSLKASSEIQISERAEDMASFNYLITTSISLNRLTNCLLQIEKITEYITKLRNDAVAIP